MEIIAAIIGFTGIVVGAILQYVFKPLLDKLFSRQKEDAEKETLRGELDKMRLTMQKDLFEMARIEFERMGVVKDLEITELKKTTVRMEREFTAKEKEFTEKINRLENNNVEYMRLVTERDGIILRQQKELKHKDTIINDLMHKLEDAQSAVMEFKKMIDTGELRYAHPKP